MTKTLGGGNIQARESEPGGGGANKNHLRSKEMGPNKMAETKTMIEAKNRQKMFETKESLRPNKLFASWSQRNRF